MTGRLRTFATAAGVTAAPVSDRSGASVAPVLLSVAAVTASYAVEGDAGALWVLTLCLALTALAIGARLTVDASADHIERVSIAVLGLGLVWQFARLATAPPVFDVRRWADIRPTFLLVLAVAAVLAAAGFLRRPPLRRTRFFLLVLVHLGLGVLLIHQTPEPSIDVYVFQRDSANALLHGNSPYGIDFPNIYPTDEYYGEGIVEGDRVTFGPPYPPLSLMMATAGEALGDPRYAHLAALEGAAVLMSLARPGRLAVAAATLFLFNPSVFFVLEQSWTEPFVILLFSATMFAALRHPRVVPLLYGLLLAVKQYLFFTVLLLPLLLGRPFELRRYARHLGVAAVVAGIVTLPWMLGNVDRFWTGMVLFQFRQPFRADSLSFTAALVNAGGPRLPDWVGFAFMLPAVLLVRRAPCMPTAFAAASALLYGLFFAWGKQAFPNYYFFVFAALCCAVAMMDPRSVEGSGSEERTSGSWASAG